MNSPLPILSYLFIRHYRDVHNAFPPMYEHLPKFYCSQCPNICISKSQLTKHEYFAHSKKRIQTQPRQQCAICGKDFAAAKNLKNHMIMIHGDSTQFKCEICDKRMPSGGKLKDHIKGVHTKVTCEICHEIQYNWYYLRRHKTSAHGIIPSGYSKCPHCALTFRQNASLLKHIDSKHK